MYELTTKLLYKTIKTSAKDILCIISSTLSDIFNTQDLIRKMCEFNQNSFVGNERKLTRLLDSKSFQINDESFRMYFNFLFDSLTAKGLQKGEEIHINIDYTTIKDKFLILYTSLVYDDINYPLYFSMRINPNDPSFDHKLLEKSFIKVLRHLLSKKYEYIIVADRSFGNSRFLTLLQENNFNFCIRINQNLGLKMNDKNLNLQDFFGEDTEFCAFVKKWQEEFQFSVCTEGDKSWFIIYNTAKNRKNTYENRFKIEAMFKNFKSNGFNIEDTKIKNYSRLKKMLFIYMISNTIYLFVGSFMANLMT